MNQDMRLVCDSLDLPGIEHGFFTRTGGVSEGVYAGLNCGTGSNDDPAAVRENRSLIAQALRLGPDALVSLYQVHSPDVVVVDEPWGSAPEDKPRADAMVTRRTDIGLGILVADCAPVLFADQDAGVIGAAHAGWKGAVEGVVEATISAMENLGAERANICAAVGPCIHQPSYEVDDGFRVRVVSINDRFGRFFALGERDGHHQFDLPGFVLSRLEDSGIGVAGMIDADTYSDEGRFYSYRRATHRGEPDYGRNIAVIRLAEAI